MRFDRGLRASYVQPYPNGYRAPSVAENSESPIFDLANHRGGGPGEWIGSHSLPSVVCLRVQIRPIFVRDDTILAEYVDDSRSLGAVPIYHLPIGFGSGHSSIQLVYQGIGTYQQSSNHDKQPFVGTHIKDYDLVLERENILYEKPFAFQVQQPVIRLQVQQKRGGVFITPPGQENAHPLWAYGGFYQPGCRLEDIEQKVFSILQDRSKTTIHLTSLNSWLKQGVDLKHGGMVGREKVCFMDMMDREQTLSLPDAIFLGKARIRLGYGVDEQGEALSCSYLSYAVTQVVSNVVDVSFKKE